MAATVTGGALNARELLSKINGLAQRLLQPSMVRKSFSGNGSTTVFSLPSGFSPLAVFVGGSILADAVWSVTYDINIASIEFTSAPASGTGNIQVLMVRS
jgi:hypothetical protein